MTHTREAKRILRHQRIRKKVIGTTQKPRLCVHRSLKNMQAQVVDDVTGKILFGISTLDKNLRQKIKSGGNVQAAAVLGEAIAIKAKTSGVSKVCFDRGGNLYHGRIKAFAEAVRKGGIQF